MKFLNNKEKELTYKLSKRHCCTKSTARQAIRESYGNIKLTIKKLYQWEKEADNCTKCFCGSGEYWANCCYISRNFS